MKTEMSSKTEGMFEGWVILELMGHRKLGGYLQEETICGKAMARIDVVNVEGAPIATQFYSPDSIYCITPVTQDVAVSYGANQKPEPVTRWELPAPKAVSPDYHDEYEREEY
jgi:hypothetical protein